MTDKFLEIILGVESFILLIIILRNRYKEINHD